MHNAVEIKRALLSVADKTDLVPFAKALIGFGVEIISTGGTAKALTDANVKVTPIDEVTNFPEMMGGRVKTLHPRVHGALLALRDTPEHKAALKEHEIKPIDLVCVNLYPFERAVSEPDVGMEDAIEQIDIGGPSMLRSGAKNFKYVTVVTSPRQYDRVISEIDGNGGATTLRLRSELAAAAFSRTAEYDAAISSWLSRHAEQAFPDILRVHYIKAMDLRYGENPHQDAALYRDPASTGPTIVNARQLFGKPLSYNNINDTASALELAKDLRRLAPDRVGAVVVKHTNACGAAVGDSGAGAVAGAMAGDPMAAYGGILAVNRPLDGAGAERIVSEGTFLEVIAAPEFQGQAAETLKEKWSNVRLLEVGDRAGSTARKMMHRSVPGGMLVQDRDTRTASTDQWRHVAGPAPADEQLADASFVWTFCKHLSSNAIAIGGRDSGTGTVRLFGAGPGQCDRLTACRVALWKAGDHSRGAIAASDAFFPFADGPAMLIDAGVRVIIQPGGSKRDNETIELCEQRGVTCIFTGVRHFKH